MSVQELLASWGVNQETLDIFAKNDITSEVLPYLNDNELKEILPNSIGMRILISRKLKELRQDENKENWSIRSNATSTATTLTNESHEVNESFNLVDLDISTLFNSTSEFPDFDLHTLLQTSPMGSSVLKYYATNKILDNTRRGRLVDIIIKHLYTYIIKHRLKHAEYNMIAAKIISVFPKECMGTYYVPAVKKSSSVSGKSVMAKGKLVDKLRNLIHKCESAEPKRKRKYGNNCTLVSTNDTEEPSSSKSIKMKEVHSEDVLWLKINREPWDDVFRKWNTTFEIREFDRTRGNKVNDFLQQWPVIIDPRGHSLVNCDFKRMYPDKDLKLFTKWEPFIDVVVNLKANNIKDHYISQYLELRNTTISRDGKFLIELMCLPYLIPPKGRVIDSNKKHWKFSTLEVVESIIVQAKTPGDIQEVIQKQKDKAYARKQTLQPYLLYEGSNIETPKSIYLIFDDFKYQLESSEKAFDILFKLFHVLQAEYPIEANYIYTLIQKGVYEIRTTFDNLPPYILDILSNLDVTEVLAFEV